MILEARGTPGFARQRPWLGQVGLRAMAGVPGPVAAPQGVTIYAQDQGQAPSPTDSEEVQNLAQHGARLDIEIGVPSVVADYYKARGQTPPAPQKVRAMIDSGASISGIKPAIAKAAGLIQTSSVGVSGVIGTENRPVYTAAIKLPSYNVDIDVMDIAGVELAQQDLDVLIGRDILKHTVFTYDGTEGVFSLEERPTATKTILVAGGVALATVGAVLLFG